jgi:hypothetical protein
MVKQKTIQSEISLTGVGFGYKSRRMGSISNYLISNMIIYKLVVDFINWYNKK